MDLDQAPPRSDLLTAEHLGRRVATLAQQWARGRQVDASQVDARVEVERSA